MANTIYDSGMTPVNRQAGVVISDGIHYEPKVNLAVTHDRRVAYEVRPLTQLPENVRHFIGARFGHLQVIGLAATKKGLWVVRCSCGVYTLRRAPAIRNLKNINDACAACSLLLRLKTKELQHRTGKDLNATDVPGSYTKREPLPPPIQSNMPYVAAKNVERKPRKRKPPPPAHYTEERRAEPTMMELAIKAAQSQHQKRDR